MEISYDDAVMLLNGEIEGLTGIEDEELIASSKKIEDLQLAKKRKENELSNKKVEEFDLKESFYEEEDIYNEFYTKLMESKSEYDAEKARIDSNNNSPRSPEDAAALLSGAIEDLTGSEFDTLKALYKEMKRLEAEQNKFTTELRIKEGEINNLEEKIRDIDSDLAKAKGKLQLPLRRYQLLALKTLVEEVYIMGPKRGRAERMISEVERGKYGEFLKIASDKFFVKKSEWK